MRRLLWTLIGVGLLVILTTGVVFALNYEGEGFCEHAKAWPNGTYLGQMHPYHSDFYTRYAAKRGWDPCATWATDQRNSAIRGLRELGYTVAAPGVASAPTPVATPDPTPAPSSDPGDWRYLDTVIGGFISLDAYDHTNQPFQDDPSFRISCFRGRPGIVFDGGGPWIGPRASVAFTVGTGSTEQFVSDRGDDLEYVGFSDRDSLRILELMGDAEGRDAPLHVDALGGSSRVRASFDVSGFATNRARLPC